MKLKASPIGDGTAGMIQILSQMANLTIQLQDIKRGKEVQEGLQCTQCRTNGHTKGDFLDYMNYISSDAPSPLSTQGMPWCNIYQTRGHHDVDCMFLQKMVCTPVSLCCKFCRSVGHDEKYCRTYQLMREKMLRTHVNPSLYFVGIFCRTHMPFNQYDVLSHIHGE